VEQLRKPAAQLRAFPGSGPSSGGALGTFPACAQMLRALTSALRLPRPWRPLRTRSCASHGATGDPEIQVRALTGRDQGITEILMNRPSARNALGNILVSELLEALAQLREDQQVRVLLFRSGVKGVFCAGGFPPLPLPRGSARYPQPTGGWRLRSALA